MKTIAFVFQLFFLIIGLAAGIAYAANVAGPWALVVCAFIVVYLGGLVVYAMYDDRFRYENDRKKDSYKKRFGVFLVHIHYYHKMNGSKEIILYSGKRNAKWDEIEVTRTTNVSGVSDVDKYWANTYLYLGWLFWLIHKIWIKFSASKK